MAPVLLMALSLAPAVPSEGALGRAQACPTSGGVTDWMGRGILHK